ncbi:AAA family ATPase [Phenylobacterium montanum]|uniref:AAA family ATPase n=1 Tax=Phenylobacterium montanum TaxID=2823693 RepID=A0A975G2N5_9CAUL|nr:AAA family ATPase [Caulobacter sp. S6]QUD89367.1 AAA family ATPase [Caulobacter sp. S6]
MADVFISYARRSARLAEAAAEALRALGYSVWFDADIPAHRAYSRVIEEELDQSKAALVLWSEDATRSEWVLSEADRARTERKLVQVMLDPMRLPMPFDQIQCADLVDWQGDLGQTGWRKVVASIADLVKGAAEPTPPPAPAPAPLSGPTSERRRLTFLTCHIVGAAGLAARLDPESWLDVAVQFQQVCRQAIEALGGRAKRAGDGLAGYFGYPVAQEDAAERAVRAGLAIVEAVAEQRWSIEGDSASLAVRVGVHAGTVVVALGDGGEVELFGDALAVTGLVEAEADAGGVLVTDAVHDLVSGQFSVETLGPRVLQGVPAPVELFRVLRPRSDMDRSRGPASREASPFVGRDDELALLCGRWERVKEGEGQLVLVTGEPGIGKSRIIEEFAAHITGDTHLWAVCAGQALSANTPFHAVVQICHQAMGCRGDEAESERLARLEAALQRAGLQLDPAVPVLAGILGLAAPEKYPPLNLAPDQQRAQLFATLVEWVLFSASAERPFVVVVEDLQWVDPSTMELLQTLSEQGATAPVLMLLTARPEFQVPWRPRGHHAQVSLDRLSSRATRSLVEGVVSGAGLGGDMVEAIIKRTDGVPLFVEALTRLVQDRRDAGLEGIPATLLDSLTARLDRLGPAKEVAQLASVLGREFTYELLQAVSSLPEADLRASLARLIEAELLHARGVPPRANYQFKHALIQDAAYETLLKRKRQGLHARVAQTLVDRFAELAAAQPELVAAHWARAGEVQPALAAWKDAGDAAYARRAFKESEAHYRQGLELLRGCPASSERDAKELDLTSALNRVLQLTRGYAAPETIEAASRARALAEKSGALSLLIREEARIWRSIITAGDYAAAAALADHIRELARAEGDNPGRLVFVHNAQLQTCFYTGDLDGVERCFAELSPLIDTPGLRQAPGNNVVAIGIASLTAWAQGRTAEAHARMQRALDFAEAADNAYDRAMALHFLGNLRISERDADAAEATASKLLLLAQQNGFAYLASLARMPLGWARAQKGATREGVDLIRQTLADQVTSGARVSLGGTLNRLAEALQLHGAFADALAVIGEALKANPQERVYRPESFRIRGQLRLAMGDAAPGEADLRTAVGLAREMGFNAFELRAAFDLARLLCASGRAQEARDLVAPIRARFAPGDESLEVRDVDAWLAGLPG